MLRKIREAQMGDREEGFTLIELLVVVIIIGILAAIAIPVFLNQRQKARNAAANSDLRNLITAQEAYFTDNDTYTNDVAAGGALASNGFTRSSGVLVCTTPTNTVPKFVAASKHSQGTLYFYYDSAVGQIFKNATLPSSGYCVPA